MLFTFLVRVLTQRKWGQLNVHVDQRTYVRKVRQELELEKFNNADKCHLIFLYFNEEKYMLLSTYSSSKTIVIFINPLVKYSLTTCASCFTIRRSSSMVINACIIIVRYVTHFIPRISVLTVCLDKEIDDGFTCISPVCQI